jgi:arylsulfatase A-like enzyme
MNDQQRSGLSRRNFLKTNTLGGAALLAHQNAHAVPATGKKPNILYIITDQQHIQALSAHGCPYVQTPNMDRLVEQGTSFLESYSTNPVCSPARSSLFTGRTTCETSVITNGEGIRPDIPNVGQWMKPRGYETIFCGKWHIPGSWTYDIPGFTVLPGGTGGKGTLGDQTISRSCEGYLRNRSGSDPFLLVATFLQPHDVCNFTSRFSEKSEVPDYPEIMDNLPPVPDNFEFDGKEPKGARLNRRKVASWTKLHWQYYLWSYYRMVEEVDAEIGRILNALDDTGEADNTVIILTSDHGEGCGSHQMILKNTLYDESAKVPLVVSWPGNMRENIRDTEHLVSGLDIMATICDYADVPSPPKTRGRSLRPLLENNADAWQDFVVTEVLHDTGRMIRTNDYKLIAFRDDPVRQLFDMKNDPGETRNLIDDSSVASVYVDLKKTLDEWEAHLDHAPNALPPFRVEG